MQFLCAPVLGALSDRFGRRPVLLASLLGATIDYAIMATTPVLWIRLENARGKDLYQFWGDIITNKLNEALAAQGDNVVINLASDEYFKSVKPKKLNAEIIKPVFLDEKNGKFKIISFYAKKARGLMSRFIIENRLTKPEQLTGFNSEGYFFDEDSSSNGELVFKRYEQR
ncbi:hypothetical protein IAM_23537 (plasmid) [Escherichia coli XH001]|nr:hypothetical protein IAM_23537 [Escherichia coli XH001]